MQEAVTQQLDMRTTLVIITVGLGFLSVVATQATAIYLRWKENEENKKEHLRTKFEEFVKYLYLYGNYTAAIVEKSNKLHSKVLEADHFYRKSAYLKAEALASLYFPKMLPECRSFLTYCQTAMVEGSQDDVEAFFAELERLRETLEKEAQIYN